jgi:glutamate synthase (NADPH/NADH) large chain
MSGGIAYVYDPDDRFAALVNYELVDLVPLDDEDREWLRATVERHRELTGSDVADGILAQWGTEVAAFRKVMPEDYRRVLTVMREAAAAGLSEEETLVRVMESSHG